MVRVALSWSLLLALGCAATPVGSVAPGPGSSGACSVRLPAPSGDTTPLGVRESRPQPPSRILVRFEESLAALLAELEPRVQRRLAAGRVGIGPGGSVSYEAVRGALSASVTASAIVLEAPVTARAEACRGDSCYASCEPDAIVRAEVPLRLRADYGFEPARVSLRFVRGCKVRALGGLLSIDVTPTLRQQLEPELQRAGLEIDRQLPKLRAEIEHGYRLAAEPRELPLLGCFLLAPEAIVQGPVLPSTSHLRASFALLARPELRPSCGSSGSPPLLPSLSHDPTMSEPGVMTLGLVSDLAQLEQAFVAAGSKPIAGKQVRIERAQVSAHGADVTVRLTLADQVCGDVSFVATPRFAGEGEHVGLASPRATDAERDRIEHAELDPAALLDGLAAVPHVPPLLSPRGLRESAPLLAAELAPRSVKVSARVDSAQGGGAVARGEQLVAWVQARGVLTVTR